MARGDLLIDLVKAGVGEGLDEFRNVVETIIAEERAKNHNILADRLEDAFTKSLSQTKKEERFSRNGHSDQVVENYLTKKAPNRSIDELILKEEVKSEVNDLVEEQNRIKLLRSYDLEPRNRVLLVGPPGNGKTSLAEVIANNLCYPLFVVRYENVIGSYLGETAERLSKVFEYARQRECVLFFDEFDAVGKERGDEQETGEIKRVVNSLLLQIDDLPSHVFLISATNHPELLDRASWRRFQSHISLDRPNFSQRKAYFKNYAAQFDEPMGVDPETLSDKFDGMSFSHLENFCTDVRRKYVLNLPDTTLKNCVRECMKIWTNRLQAKENLEN